MNLLHRLASQPGTVRCLFATDIDTLVQRLLRDLEALESARLVSCPVKPKAMLDDLLTEVLCRLAEPAGALWPHWYSGHDGARAFPAHADALAMPGVHSTWLRAAAGLCGQGRLPLLPTFPHALQARQLALALGANDLWLLLVCDAADMTEHALYSLARAAEWLGRHTQARLLLLLPARYRGQAALDSVSHGAVTPDAGAERPVAAPEIQVSGRGWLWPVIGRPHPQSPGEQALAAALAADAELSRCFEFNVHVKTRHGSRFLVDLLWRAGRLVVEVDGFRFHGTSQALERDHARDYELTLSGYTVLRLMSAEILRDVALAVAKIRDLVRFQQQHPRQHLGEN